MSFRLLWALREAAVVLWLPLGVRVGCGKLEPVLSCVLGSVALRGCTSLALISL